MVALDHFRRLGHDNHRRLCKVYGWEEKKSKTSWGAETVDYEKIAAAAVQAMSAADLHRFLVVCALVSDLYCPGYDPRQTLAKDSQPCPHRGAAQCRYSKGRQRCPNGVGKKADTSPTPSTRGREITESHNVTSQGNSQGAT